MMLVAPLWLVACSASAPAPEAADRPPRAETPRQPESRNPLADTRWQLVEFQSMDDSQGILRTDDPSKYTMTLNTDGTVTMRLNCNRATGTWSIRPAADDVSGSFRFGPLTMTRALCPPPSMDEHVAGQAEYIRGYLLRDGNLYLSLMADGGIYAWQPVASAVRFETTPDAEIEAAIRAASHDYTKAVVEIGGQARYLYSRVDLDDDGDDEVLVYLLGSIFCGTGGCNLLVLTRSGEGYSLVNDFPTTRTPVIVATQRTNGWRDIWRLRSGGGAPSNYIADRFDGNKYADAEVVPANDPPDGTPVLTGEFAFEDGIPLQPGD